jgi:tryptophanyl-tRNA synthetase
MVTKRHLEDILQALLAPIRERRARYAGDPGYVMNVLRQGTREARERTQATVDELRAALGLFTLI